ncbi:cell wall / vacuolar inhibitor of fructosidase 2-like [Quercus suber]|uniref:cell wall / vacuolar inhibitor of fructosidase 2-like n=1 Tax=Quercus suber TaxID=58331 RepID=UPI000CE24956|nr:cell wall / vacuolar inhibitor of fructosidase 2-like [Quercus suber]
MAMKIDVSLCLFVIPIVLSLLLSSHHFAKADNEIGEPLITATCRKTEFPDVCSSTLESDPRTSSANLKGLSRIALELAIIKANETKRAAFSLINNATSYENQGKRLACYDGFASRVNQFVVSLQNFDQLKYSESNRIVEVFIGGLNYCIDLGVAELSTRITFLRKFTTDVKAILHLLF